ncbi:MAG: rod shape-determining protein RodA [Bacteroidales bacterium]|nr:rod shape-determining protein RodA [Bacteroidales bacterium]
MSGRRIDIFANLDWTVIGLYFALLILGLVNIYSAEFSDENQNFFDFSLRSGKQIIWIGFALVLALFILIIDSRFYMYFANPLYLFIILSLIGVLIIGQEIHGSKSWFQIGSIRLQPSEFAKFATGLALARYLSSPNIKLQNYRTIAISLVIIFSPALLILLQPDTGSSLVYASLFIVLYREGLPGIYLVIGIVLAFLFILTLLFDKITITLVLIVMAFLAYFFLEGKKKYFLKGIGFFILLLGFLWVVNQLIPTSVSNYLIILVSLGIIGTVYTLYALRHKLRYVFLIFALLIGSIAYTYSVDYVFNNVLGDHQQKRINVLLGIESDPLGSGYNVNQSKIAIGSGGFKGKGFLRGTQTKFNFVPEQSTDFIFCTVGEEWGFVGTTVVILLFAFLLIRILILAERQRSTFSRMYGYSVFSIILFHFIINIGMTIGLVPVIGIPLPLISYGGSSLWAFTIMIFIFLKLDASKTEFL